MKIKELTAENFDSEINAQTENALVDFWAPWCGPCRMIAPVLEKIAADFAGKILVAKVNTDENPEYALKYGVQSIPTVFFIHGGKIIHRQIGALPEPNMREAVEQFLTALEQK